MTDIAEPDVFRTRDGAQLEIRPIQSTDRRKLAAHFERLSDRSRYQRFLGFKRRLDDEELTRLTALDHHDREALIALDDEGELVAVARYLRLDERPGTAEVAIAVDDEWQHRGAGSVLLARLMERAVAEGVTTFVASCLATNRKMITLFSELGQAVVCVGRDAGVVELEILLPLPKRR